MKIAVVNSYVPFQTSGADQLPQTLTSKLIEYGYEALLIRIPFCGDSPSKIIDSMLACRMMCFPNVDRLIALNVPACCVPHHEKVVWIHNTSWLGREIQESIQGADNLYLSEAHRVFTTSRRASETLTTYNSVESQVLWPPLFETNQFTCNSYDDFVFNPSLVNHAHRQWLAVESMRHVSSPVRLILAGEDENDADARRIDKIISTNGLEGRVAWLGEAISEPSKVDLFSRALGTLCIASDEDSYGCSALESYYSQKPVITCTDSRETSLLVKDGVSGFVVNPSPQEIGRAIDRLYQDKAAAQAMGRAGLDLIRSLGITWTHVVEALTE